MQYNVAHDYLFSGLAWSFYLGYCTVNASTEFLRLGRSRWQLACLLKDSIGSAGLGIRIADGEHGYNWEEWWLSSVGRDI